MNAQPLFNPYWGPGPAHPFPIVQRIYAPQLAEMIAEAARKPGLYRAALEPFGSVQTEALLLGPSVLLRSSE